MTDRAKQTSLIILIPTTCMAVGLWMQYQNTVAVIHQARERGLWDQLAATAALVEESGTTAEQRDLVLRRAARDLVTRGDGSTGGITRVDSQGRVIAHFPQDGANAPVDSAARAATTRRPIRKSHNSSGAPNRVMLVLDGADHYAIGLPDKFGGGRVFIHLPAAAVASDVATLTESLPAISAITLIWSSAVLTIAVFVVLGKTQARHETRHVRSSHEILQQARSLARTQDAIIFGLAKLADSRDSDTGEHLDRISNYATMIASSARQHPKFAATIDAGFVRLIGISSALHDIGKVGVEDGVLLKRGPLTPQERGRMQEHSVIGGNCLKGIEQRLGSSNFLQMAREIAFSHHERWDGGGYPAGLKGEEIPLAARIVAIADVYDALSSKRAYKQAFTHERCVAIIRENAGKQFDPDLVEIWLGIEPKFEAIGRRRIRGHGSAPTGDCATAGGESVSERVNEVLPPHRCSS